MKLVVGLGNPGAEYKNTRHNAGFMVIDKLNELNFHAAEKVIFLKPQTFMNNSGREVRNHIKGLAFNNLIVVHDELDLPIGQIKVQLGGGSAGHNGVQSIIDRLGSQDFIRVRIGVQALNCDIKTGAKAKDYLLSNFTKEDREIIDPVIEKAARSVDEILSNGVDSAMNQFN